MLKKTTIQFYFILLLISDSSCGYRNPQLIKFNSSYFNEPKIVIRYTELNCNSCVDSLFAYVKECFNKEFDEDIVVFSQYNDMRLPGIFKRINKINYEFYNVNGEQSNLSSIDMYNIPYVFILKTNGEMEYLLLYNKDKKTMIKKFKLLKKKFKTIKKNYNEQRKDIY